MRCDDVLEQSSICINLSKNGNSIRTVHMCYMAVKPPDWGTWRFLPWHRFYLYYFELALQASGGSGPNVSIPYWDWTVDQAIPDWLIKITQPVLGQSNNEFTFPIIVWRDPDGPGKTLPPPEDVAKLMQTKTYSDFTQCLEMGKGCAVGKALGFESEMHNQVHNWVGGTMTSTSTAPADIIFWMLTLIEFGVNDRVNIPLNIQKHSAVRLTQARGAILLQFQATAAMHMFLILSLGDSRMNLHVEASRIWHIRMHKNPDLAYTAKYDMGYYIMKCLLSFRDACRRQLHSPSSPSNCNDLNSYY
jgi:Common central domain of tyrosinase